MTKETLEKVLKTPKVKTLINKNDFSGVYEYIDRDINYDVSKFTQLLYNSGIDPFKYIDHLYDFYGYWVKFPFIQLTIPSKFKIIPFDSFGYSSGLTKVVLNIGVESIKSLAFESCSAKEYYLPSTLKEIKGEAFLNKSIKVIYNGSYDDLKEICGFRKESTDHRELKSYLFGHDYDTCTLETSDLIV